MAGKTLEEAVKEESVQVSACEAQEEHEVKATEKQEWGPPTEQDFEACFEHTEAKLMGCSHYPLGLKVRAACCGKFFPCRVCHDEEISDHKINRHAVTEMLCMHCHILQPIAQNCKNCGESLGRYYCDICKFHDDTLGKEIYHCPHCGICRRGKGLDIDFFHCNVCNMCLSVKLKGDHKCVENNSRSDCVICGNDLFSSRQPVEVLKCGHVLHRLCFKNMLTHAQYCCPLCKTSMVDMTEVWQQIDTEIARQPMPTEFAEAIEKVLCNDCNTKSDVPFHWLGQKCRNTGCGGYNTSTVQRIGRWPTREQWMNAAAIQQQRQQGTEPSSE